MSIKLENYHDRDVVVQLRPGLAWLLIKEDGGVPVAADTKNGSATPFLEGKVVLSAGQHVLRVVGPGNGKHYIEVDLHPDAILAISALGEPRVLRASTGGIVLPQ
jgi:hypothetical protein